MKTTTNCRVTQRLFLRGSLGKGPPRPCLRPPLPIVVNKCDIFSLKCTRIRLAAGLRSDLLWELKSSPRPPSRYKGKGPREGKGGVGGGSGGRKGGTGRGKEKEGQGREWERSEAEPS